MFIVTQFLWIRNLGAAGVSHKISQNIDQGYSYPKARVSVSQMGEQHTRQVSLWLVGGLGF